MDALDAIERTPWSRLWTDLKDRAQAVGIAKAVSEKRDNIFFDLTDAANTANQAHIIAIAKTLFSSQTDLYRVNVLPNRPKLLESQTLKEMLGDDDPPEFIQEDVMSRRQAAANAWMLDSASDGLNERVPLAANDSRTMDYKNRLT